MKEPRFTRWPFGANAPKPFASAATVVGPVVTPGRHQCRRQPKANISDGRRTGPTRTHRWREVNFTHKSHFRFLTRSCFSRLASRASLSYILFSRLASRVSRVSLSLTILASRNIKALCILPLGSIVRLRETDKTRDETRENIERDGAAQTRKTRLASRETRENIERDARDAR